MLKFWPKSKSKQQKPETDAYSQVLTHTDPYYESFRSNMDEKVDEQYLEKVECQES